MSFKVGDEVLAETNDGKIICIVDSLTPGEGGIWINLKPKNNFVSWGMMLVPPHQIDTHIKLIKAKPHLSVVRVNQ